MMRCPLTFYIAGWPLKDWMAGEVFAYVVLIRKGWENDVGLLMHEMMHVKQAAAATVVGALLGYIVEAELGLDAVLNGALAGLIVWELAYKFIRRVRLFAEVQAYTEQMQYPDRKGNNMTLETAAWRLYGGGKDTYGLGLTMEQAQAAFNFRSIRK